MSSAGPATRLEQLILYQLSAFAYIGCAALLIFTVVRLSGYESAAALALYGVTPWLYVPVYAAVGYAFGARKRLLLALSIVVAIVHIVTIWPDIKPPDHLSATARHAPACARRVSHPARSYGDVVLSFEGDGFVGRMTGYPYHDCYGFTLSFKKK